MLPYWRYFYCYYCRAGGRCCHIGDTSIVTIAERVADVPYWRYFYCYYAEWVADVAILAILPIVTIAERVADVAILAILL